MKQFLSNILPRRMRSSKERLQQSPGIRYYPLIVITTVSASCLIVGGYLAREHPAVAVLSSLLVGFAPLLGLGVLLILVALLTSFLICTVERTLADEDDGIVPEPHLKSKWHRVTSFPSELLTYCLGLKEHSPPAFLFS